jgi:hypothetical protein
MDIVDFLEFAGIDLLCSDEKRFYAVSPMTQRKVMLLVKREASSAAGRVAVLIADDFPSTLSK